jgi:S-adenosylmethionine hydrolase
MKILTFLTDFGSSSCYIAQMKGAALSLTDTNIIDITHNIKPHNIMEGAFVLLTTVPYFPVGTVHVAVVDPGVGTNRRSLVITTKTQILIGPDNGLLIPVAKYLGHFTVYEITNPDLFITPISKTFHGRDIFTPVAAHILNGVMFEKIGPIINDFIDLEISKFEISNKTITGKIIFVDDFGNIITNIDGDYIKKKLSYKEKLILKINNKRLTIPFVESYNFVEKGKLVALVNSSNFLEIAINKDNAAKRIGIKNYDSIKVYLI